MSLELPLHLPSFFAHNCNDCDHPVSYSVDMLSYMHGETHQCTECKAEINIYQATVKTLIGQSSFIFKAASLIDTKRTVFTLQLQPETPFTLKFVDFGIPSSASITSINFTPEGGSLFPLIMQGNQIMPARYIPNELVLYPAPIMRVPGEKVSETKINAFVTWTDSSNSDPSTLALLDAAYYFEQDLYEKLIVPANVAAERIIGNTCFTWLRNFSNKENTERFLQNSATYSSQLKILLPMIISLIGAPPLQHEIKGALNRLRELRNQIAHGGSLEQPLTKRDAAELFVSAVLTSNYLTSLAPRLVR